MVKAVLATGLVLAGAEKVALTYTDCGSSSTHAKITSLKPDTIDVPGKATIVGSGALDSDQTSASFSLKVKKGLVPLVSGKGSICEDTTIKIPLGAGSFTVKGIDCPAKQGNVDVEVDLDILSDLFADGENSLLSIHIEANADDTGDQVICLDVDASLAAERSYEQEWAEFQAVNGQQNGGIPHAFKENVDFVERENARQSDYQLSYLSPFAAMSSEEFKATMLTGLKTETERVSLGTYKATGATDLPESIDWVVQGAVSPVKDQGQCGSCWAFSTVGALEGRAQIAKGSLQQFSEQQFVDCDTEEDQGCNGGLMDSAFKYAETADICTEDSYAYKGKGGSCSTSGCTVGLKAGEVSGFVDVDGTEQALMEAVAAGPVSVAVDAETIFQLYSKGIMSGLCGASLDHGVLAVGYGTDNGKDYWKVKNSWGSRWGEDGYVRMLRGKGGKGQCGILSGPPSYPVIGGSVEI